MHAPLAMRPVHLIEQNGLKGLLDLVSQILGLAGGGKG